MVKRLNWASFIQRNAANFINVYKKHHKTRQHEDIGQKLEENFLLRWEINDHNLDRDWQTFSGCEDRRFWNASGKSRRYKPQVRQRNDVFQYKIDKKMQHCQRKVFEKYLRMSILNECQQYSAHLAIFFSEIWWRHIYSWRNKARNRRCSDS